MTGSQTEINNEFINIISDLDKLYSTYFDLDEDFDGERKETTAKLFNSIKKNLDEQVLRIAVVGAIKSGKSTFINSFLKSDFLKRGAGVITSVVTRVKTGEMVKAIVSFKPIEEINKDILNSVVLLPDMDDFKGFDSFDIRNIDDRENLKKILDKLKADQLISSDSREAKSVYLQSYLSGFERLDNIIESGSKEFSGDNFHEYKSFASEEPLAVYVKDILVQIPEKSIDNYTEIADCQGSDSTNPLHIARIQDYLLKANFILYIVSTRTGLRQADIKFLNMLKKMGLTDQAAFVLNSDISEHDDIKDLKRVESNTIEEILLIKPEARVFTISALYELLTDNYETLSKKDRLRLEQWNIDEESVSYLHNNFREFKKYFDEDLILKKHFFFYSSCLKKLADQGGDLKKRLEIKKKLIEKEVKDQDLDLKKEEKKFNDVKNLIKNTLEGSRQKYDKNLKAEVDSFFDFHSEGTGKIFDFINSYSNDFEKYIAESGDNKVKVNYFSLYQDFKQELDNYVTQEVNPIIISFVKEKENEIISYFYELSKSYESMVFDALTNFTLELGQEFSISTSNLPKPEDFGIEKKFNLPSALDIIDYNIAIRGSAMAGSGFIFFKNLFNRVFKSKSSVKDDAVKTIKKSLERIKKETEKSLKNHFLNYRENLKFQYILKFSDFVKDEYYKSLTERLDSYVNDFANILRLMEKNHGERQVYLEKINRIYSETIDLMEKIEKIENKLTC